MRDPSAPYRDTSPPPPYASNAPPPAANYGTMYIEVQQQLQDTPVQVMCPNCHSIVWTVVTYNVGVLTYLASVALCFVGCNAGCCLVPFCMDSCKDAIHTCPMCSAEIGRWQHL